MDISIKQKIAATFLSLSPMEAAEALKKLTEHQALKVGAALLQYGHIRFNLSQALDDNNYSSQKKSNNGDVSEQDISNFIDAYKQSNDHFSPQLLSQKKKTNGDISSLKKIEGESFLRIIADDHSSLEVVKALYQTAYGNKKAMYLIRKLIHSQLADDFSFLHKYTTKEVYSVIKNESVSIISFVMEVMEAQKSATILTMLSEELRGEVILYIAKRKLPHIQACQTIRNVLKDKLKNNAEHNQKAINTGGVDSLVDILSYMPFAQQQELIETIQDKKLKTDIEKKAMDWKFLLKLPSNVLKKIFQEFSDSEITLLLCLKEEGSKEVVKQSVSENRIQKIEEEINYLQNNISLQKAEELKKRFFMLAKRYFSHIDKK